MSIKTKKRKSANMQESDMSRASGKLPMKCPLCYRVWDGDYYASSWRCPFCGTKIFNAHKDNFGIGDYIPQKRITSKKIPRFYGPRQVA